MALRLPGGGLGLVRGHGCRGQFCEQQNITFTSTIDDDSAGDTDLTLTAGTGAVDLQGAVGATNRLDDFTVASTATSDLMNVTADTITDYEYNIDLKGTTYTSSVGGITLTGAVDLDLSAGTVTVDSSANNQNILPSRARSTTTLRVTRILP